MKCYTTVLYSMSPEHRSACHSALGEDILLVYVLFLTITEAVHSFKKEEALLCPYLDVGKCKRSSVWSLQWCRRFLSVYSGCFGCEDLPQATIDLWTPYSQLGEDVVHFLRHFMVRHIIFLGFCIAVVAFQCHILRVFLKHCIAICRHLATQ